MAMTDRAARAVRAGRRFWRWLTSMRTALVLLVLLAVAAVPGSLLPQRGVHLEKVTAYLADHPTAGRWIDRFGGFDVYASPWFSAIYLLLFGSLVGCLVPRLRSHATALLRPPPPAPGRLERLPVHAELWSAGSGPAGRGSAGSGPVGSGPVGGSGSVDPVLVAERARLVLRSRRYRVRARRTSTEVTLSAEKGYLKETGNLLFHVALLGLLTGVAIGALYGWHANRMLVAGADGAFCNSLQQYDEYGLGARVDGGDLEPFCLRLDDFRARYLDSGQPMAYDATMTVRRAGSAGQRTRRVSVNSPLRLPRANVYLLGHGYAPVLRYTDSAGRTQTATAPFLPRDGKLTSDGVALFPDANLGPGGSGPGGSGKNQIGFTGIYLPTAPADPSVGHSAHPAERDPRLMLQAYHGDLGLDAGTPLSVYSLDQRQLSAGRLTRFGEAHLLRVGDSWTLPDSSRVEFLGTRPWVSLSVRYDPGERIVLGGAVALLVGLLASLTGRRRRVWLRVTPTQVSAGGLTRSEYPGFQTEFDDLTRRCLESFDDLLPAEVRQEEHTGAPGAEMGSG